MEKYLPRGSHSCKPIRSPLEVEAFLRAAAQHSPLVKLYSALQPAQLFLVGGSTRDPFFDLPTADLDLTTNLSAQIVKERCVTSGLRVIETGIKHGTILVVIDDQHLEVTTFRQPSDRNIQIDARDIETDLLGRDFTINAIAFCLATHKLIDPLGGISDLSKGILRAVGDAASRLKEDPLRILRMIRFGDAQGRSIEEATLVAARTLIPLLEQISVERIKHELDQILLCEYPGAGIKKLQELGALPFTIPELMPSVGFEQNRYHIHDVFDHTLAVLDRTPRNRLLRWAAIFHDMGKPNTLSIDENGERHFYSHEVASTTLAWERMEKLRFSHDDMRRISTVVRYHMRPMNCGPAGVRRLIRDLGDNLALWRTFKDADSSPATPSEEAIATAQYFDALLEAEQKKRLSPSYGQLAVNGEDLKLLGIKPGPSMGRILKQLEEVVIEDPGKNTKEQLLQVAKTLTEHHL